MFANQKIRPVSLPAQRLQVCNHFTFNLLLLSFALRKQQQTNNTKMKINERNSPQSMYMFVCSSTATETILETTHKSMPTLTAVNMEIGKIEHKVKAKKNNLNGALNAPQTAFSPFRHSQLHQTPLVLTPLRMFEWG